MSGLERDLVNRAKARGAHPAMTTTAHAHSSESNEHYTPAWLIEKATRVLGGIDLDPMTSERANQCVHAREIMTEKDDALHKASWSLRSPRPDGLAPRVWLNPPGGKLDPKTLIPLPRNENNRQGGPGISAAAAAWCHLSNQVETDKVGSSLFLAFSLNVFRTAQDERLVEFFPCTMPPSNYPFVIFRERIRFEHVNEDGVRVSGKSPPQDSALVLLPHGGHRSKGTTEYARAVNTFVSEFSELGAITCP